MAARTASLFELIADAREQSSYRGREERSSRRSRGVFSDEGEVNLASLVAEATAGLFEGGGLARRRRRASLAGPDSRILAAGDVLVVLDPAQSFFETRFIDAGRELAEEIWIEAQELSLAERGHADLPFDAGAIAELAPTVVHTSMPRMERLCVPTPCLEITCLGATSTAGILCRDEAGTIGVTGCLHGTGPVGTDVQVGLRQAQVAAAHPVQDIVFIPLGDFNIPELVGCAGILADEAPGQGAPARFTGATSGAVQTSINSHDWGLNRLRATLQLKVQTGPDANPGDSGAALIDRHDRVVAFAFERTAFGERPEFTDWIWAANALSALRLTPLTV